ncbi:MAG: hypothetical protein ACR2HJ_09070 [Fimbriimonadales bacterium]
MPKAVHCRIDAVIATKSNQAVVFRRGPSKRCQMLVWDMSTDELRAGRWLSGHVYTKRCDVSPDGRYVVIAATNYAPSHGKRNVHPLPEQGTACGWTAISRPPYYSALALWFTGCAWNGGGIWRSEKQLSVNEFEYLWHEALAPARSIKVKSLGLPSSEDEPIFSMRLKRRGWLDRRQERTVITNEDWQEHANSLNSRNLPTEASMLDPSFMEEMEAFMRDLENSIPKYRTDVTGIKEKPFRSGFLRRETSAVGDRWSAHNDSGAEVKSWKPPMWQPQWLDVDGRGRIVFAEGGCLWAWNRFPDGDPTLIADLDLEAFRKVPPPEWALSW